MMFSSCIHHFVPESCIVEVTRVQEFYPFFTPFTQIPLGLTKNGLDQ